jgi:crotonobetainyl-CoA:carnitine CoA-transferase CaiB-like acyl-CoA transferase
MLMADNGADVIKVEPPSGDISRAREPFRSDAKNSESASAYHLAMNRGKRSVVLDLKTEDGRAALARLIATADVLVENFRPGVLARLGFDPESVAAQHPSLVVVSLSAFGGRGIEPALRDRPGVSIVAEASSGITSLTRGRDDEPVWVGFALGDLVAGLVLYSTVTTALIERNATGKGIYLDLSMAESMLALNTPGLAIHAVTGEARPDARLIATPFGVYPATDGHVAIGVNSDEFWRRLCHAMVRPDLAEDARFGTHPARIARRSEVDGVVRGWTSDLPRAEILARLQERGVPCAVVGEIPDVLSDPGLVSRGAFWSVDDGMGGQVVLPANPMRFVDRPGGAVPRLGQHTDEVLSEVGLCDPRAGDAALSLRGVPASDRRGE